MRSRPAGLVAVLVIGFYLIAPQRLDQWVSGVQSWFKPKT